MERFSNPSPDWPTGMGRPFNDAMNHAGISVVTLCNEKAIRAGLAGSKELVGFFAEGFADGALDGCGVSFEHVIRGLEQTDGGPEGGFREGEHLKEVAVKGNQIFGNEGIPCLDVFIETEAKHGDDSIITVEGNAVAVANQYEKEIEEQFLVGETLPEPIPKEPVFNGGKAPFEPAHPFGDEGCFMNQGVVPVAWRNG